MKKLFESATNASIPTSVVRQKGPGSGLAAADERGTKLKDKLAVGEGNTIPTPKDASEPPTMARAGAPRSRSRENGIALEELLAARHFWKKDYAKQFMANIVTKLS
jgi:hypothetical protein